MIDDVSNAKPRTLRYSSDGKNVGCRSLEQHIKYAWLCSHNTNRCAEKLTSVENVHGVASRKWVLGCARGPSRAARPSTLWDGVYDGVPPDRPERPHGAHGVSLLRSRHFSASFVIEKCYSVEFSLFFSYCFSSSSLVIQTHDMVDLE